MTEYRIVEQYDELIVQSKDEPRDGHDDEWTYMCSVRFGNKQKHGRVDDTWNKARAIVHALNEHEKIGIRHG